MFQGAPSSTIDNLQAHLAVLRARRDELQVGCLLTGSGDPVDRTPSVETVITVEVLDERIATLELELQNPPLPVHVDGQVSMGDLVTLDLGDGPEELLLCPQEAAPDGVDTLTPGSALGRVICGDRVGDRITYFSDCARELSATILASTAFLSEAPRESV